MKTFRRSRIFIDTICCYNIELAGEIWQRNNPVNNNNNVWASNLLPSVLQKYFAHFKLQHVSFCNGCRWQLNKSNNRLATNVVQPVVNSPNSISFVRNFQGSLQKFCSFQWLWNEIKNSDIHFTTLHNWVLFWLASKRSWKNFSHQKNDYQNSKNYLLYNSA